MVRKEDILLWFTQQPSHLRLDVLCNLAHLCLPFELRFINTCLDYLTRRSSPSARDAENLAALEKSCCPQPGDSLDLHDEAARRKLIWSLCLLQASNRAVSHTIYQIIRDTYSDVRQFSPDLASSTGGNGVRDMAIQELHLIFTMAIHHPSFTFEEKFQLGEIYRYLQTTRLLSKSRTPSPPTVITPTPTPSPPEAAAVTVTAPASSQAQMVSTSSSSGNRSPTNGRSSRSSTTTSQNSTSSLNRRHNTVRGHNKSNHSNGSVSGENSNNVSPITLLLKEHYGKDQQNYNSLPRGWRRFEKLTVSELAEHSDEEFINSGLSNTFISHLRKLINQQLQISNNHHSNDTGSSAGSTRSSGTRSNSSNGFKEEPFSNQQSIQQQPHQVGSNNKPSMGPHRSSLVKTCMGPPNVQPAFHNTQQRNQQQVMQAAVEAHNQQLQQAAQHHHHQMQIQMQQQAFHQHMQHHLAQQQQQQQQQHQQEPPLSRAGSSSSASSSGSSSLETCSPPSSPTDSATVAHRNGDADRKTYAGAAPQSVAPPTAGARPQARGPSASPAPLRGPSANAGFIRTMRNSSNDPSGNGHRHPTSSNSAVATAPAPSSSISPASSLSSSSSSSTSSTSTTSSSTSTHRAASQPRDMPFLPSLSYAVPAQHQTSVAVMAPGTASAQPNPVPVVTASAVVPVQQPTASFIVNSSTPPPHIETQPVQPVYSYHGYLSMNGDGSSGYPQPPFTFITSGPPPGSTRGVPPGPHHEMFIYSPNSFQGQLVTQPLSTHHGSSINGRMMEMPYLQPILVTTTPGPSSRSDGMGTDYSRPPPPGTSSQPDCRIGGVPSPLPGNLSCFNCGASGHLGTQCQQISVEDIIRPSPAC